MTVERRARLLGVKAQRGIALAAGAVVRGILPLHAAHQFPMAVELRLRELTVQLLQQLSEGLLLLRCARVLRRLAVLGETPDVHHTDAMAVVATLGTVCALLLDGPALVDAAVQFYHIVIPDVAPVVGRRRVPATDVRCGEGLAFRRCRTVADDFIDGSHGCSVGRLRIV